MTPRDLAQALGGEVVRVRGVEQVLAPGLGHSARDRSLSIRVGRGGFTVHSFAGGDVGAERARVQALFSQDGRVHPAARAVRPATIPVPTPDRNALWLFDEARHPWNTRAERYLSGRGIYLPACVAGAAIRYHPETPFDGRRVPAMVALVRGIESDRPQAVQRTALSWSNTNYAANGKTRMALGPISGGAVKMWPDRAVESVGELGIGEGIESVLSLHLVEGFDRLPLWSLLNAAGVRHLPVLAPVRKLVIAVDHDPTGVAAAEACARRWQESGRQVVLVTPRQEDRDLNDLVQRGRP